MFAFFVLTLVLALLTDNTQEVILNDKMVESELATENQLTHEIVSDEGLKD